MIRCFIRVLLRKCQLFHRFTIPAIQSAKIEYFAPKTNNGTQPKLNAACFVVQSFLADANFVVFSNYCLISTRLRPVFLRIGSCRERHRRTRRGSRIVIPRSEATWESRSTRPHRGKAIGKIATACPRLPRAQSALAMTNLLALRHRIRAAKPTACKALNPRKGDAASVRRQSRQRLRSERRYRRNRLVRFYRQPVRIGSAFPRLPRAQSALAMTNLLALRHRIRAAKPTACKAVTDRRYRRNWCIPFSRRPVRIGSLAKLSTFHFLFSTRRMPSPYNAPSMPPPFPSASSHTCFASSTARGRRIIPARPNRR